MSHKILLAWLLVLLFLVSPASSPSPVQARPSAVFSVNDTTDATDANPGDGICETAPGNGVCTLRAAIQETNALPGMDIIILPSGIYTLTIPGANEDNAATGDLDIRDDLLLVGMGADQTIVDGNGLDRVFDIFAPANVTLGGLALRGGANLSSGGGGIRNTGQLNINNSLVFNNTDGGYFGGGIYNSGGTLTLASSTVLSNSSGIHTDNLAAISNTLIYSNTHGGLSNQNGLASIYNSVVSGTTVSAAVYNDKGNISLENVRLTNNNAGEFGPALWNWGRGNATLISVTIDHNSGPAIRNDYSQMSVLNSLISRNGPIYGSSYEGGIYNNGVMTLTNTSVISNTSEQGGGFYNLGSATLTRPIFMGNNGNYGGAIWNSGLMTVTGGNFENNNGNMNQGGGIYSDHWLVVSGTLFKNNTAGYGGGIYIREGPGPFGSQAYISNSLFISNSAGGGGGVGNTGLLHLYNSSIISNSAYAMGGVDNTGMAHLDQVTISNNSAVQVGGIGNNGALTLTHSLIANNTTTGDGGAISNFSSYYSFYTTITSTWILENVTISDNSAPNGYGGGIFIGLPPYRAPINWLSLRNVTLSNNTALTGSNIALLTGTLQTRNSIIASGIGSSNCYFTSGMLTSLGHNLEDTNSCGLNSTGDLANTNALLGPLQDNGGNTLTHALLFGSPAIDAGDNNGCPRTDQRGWLRPFGRACDIGAFELHYPFWLPLLFFIAP